ncbi:MAG TPA: hypothetical protein VHB77_15535 [Planctomycetaceae bacterium]|nr:hypothetical protein [Planctomycetaceae bacterium]
MIDFRDEPEINPDLSEQISTRPDEDQKFQSGRRPDRFAAGTPGGGTEVGGLAGTNVGDGDPDNADLETPMGTSVEEEEDAGPPYSGHAGGAVGGTPAQGRVTGGDAGDRIAPDGSHRGDSTIGGDPQRPSST